MSSTTAVSQKLPRTAYAPESHSEVPNLCWVEQGCGFAISSSDDRLLEMAQSVFNAIPAAAAVGAVRRWKVERITSGVVDQWFLTGSSQNSSMIPVRAESREMAILHIEYDALDWLLNNSLDTATVHAALLTRNDKGVVIVGPSFSGKSTLATALWRSGWSLMCDDLVFIDTAARTASPAPRRVSLRFGSKDLVGESAWNEISKTPSCVETEKGLFFHPHEVSGTAKQTTTPLSAIFFLARLDAGAGPAEVQPMNSARGALSLVPYAFNVRTLPFVEGLRRITPLLEKVPAYDLGRGDLASMVNAVETTVG